MVSLMNKWCKLCNNHNKEDLFCLYTKFNLYKENTYNYICKSCIKHITFVYNNSLLNNINEYFDQEIDKCFVKVRTSNFGMAFYPDSVKKDILINLKKEINNKDFKVNLKYSLNRDYGKFAKPLFNKKSLIDYLQDEINKNNKIIDKICNKKNSYINIFNREDLNIISYKQTLIAINNRYYFLIDKLKEWDFDDGNS